MLNGHGDDLYQYPDIRVNFSSNVYNHFNHDGLFAHLAQQMGRVTNYPDPTPQRLEAELAADLGLKPDEVLVTNGATESIYLVAQTWRRAASSILVPTFSEYADACRIHEHTLTFLPSLEALDSLPSLDSPTSSTRLCWICNPNNPTGAVMDKSLLISTLQRHPDTLFVIDASYAPFTRRPLLSAADAAQLPNVLMLHSMTKEFAIPGLRLGFLTGPAALLRKVCEQRMPWSVNSLAQEAGHYLLSHRSDYILPLDLLLSERERLSQAFASIGIRCCPSDTHILLAQLPQGISATLKDLLARKYGLLIRDASNFQGLDERHFRIAVQTPHENDELLQALKQERGERK